MKTVDLFLSGAPRDIAGKKKLSLSLHDHATYHDVVFELAKQVPPLVGMLIAPDQRSLLSGNLFYRSDKQAVMPDDMGQTVRAGEALFLLYFIVGG